LARTRRERRSRDATLSALLPSAIFRLLSCSSRKPIRRIVACAPLITLSIFVLGYVRSHLGVHKVGQDSRLTNTPRESGNRALMISSTPAPRSPAPAIVTNASCNSSRTFSEPAPKARKS
jgi:hypothetical protein